MSEKERRYYPLILLLIIAVSLTGLAFSIVIHSRVIRKETVREIDFRDVLKEWEIKFGYSGRHPGPFAGFSSDLPGDTAAYSGTGTSKY